MRRMPILACVVCLLWIAAIPARAAGTTKHGKTAKAAHPERSIALVDLNALFKSDPDFTKTLEEIQADIARANIDIKNAGASLKAEDEEVEKLPAGSLHAQRAAIPTHPPQA